MLTLLTRTIILEILWAKTIFKSGPFRDTMALTGRILRLWAKKVDKWAKTIFKSGPQIYVILGLK